MTRPEALQRWRTRHFRAVPKQQAVRRPPQDGRPASALTEKQSAVKSDNALRHWPVGICIWPKPAEPEPNRQYDQRDVDDEVSDHGCDGTG